MKRYNQSVSKAVTTRFFLRWNSTLLDQGSSAVIAVAEFRYLL